MQVTIDITRECYDDLVDMDESIVGFEIPEHLPATFRLRWKDLLLRTKGRADVEDLSTALGVDASQTDLLVAVAHLEIEQPSAGELVIALYDERRPGQFVLGEGGQPVLLERSWDGVRAGYEYNLGGRFELPDGDCNLTLYSAGSVTLSLSHPCWHRGERSEGLRL